MSVEMLLVEAPESVAEVGYYIARPLGECVTSNYFDISSIKNLEYTDTFRYFREEGKDFAGSGGIDVLPIAGLVEDIFKKGYISRDNKHQLYDALTLYDPWLIRNSGIREMAEFHKVLVSAGMAETALVTLPATYIIGLEQSIDWDNVKAVNSDGVGGLADPETGNLQVWTYNIEDYFDDNQDVLRLAEQLGSEEFVWNYGLIWQGDGRLARPYVETLPNGNIAARITLCDAYDPESHTNPPLVTFKERFDRLALEDRY